MERVKAKKHLGQHFLKDLDAAKRIVGLLNGHGGYEKVLEIGPGMGVLTQYLLEKKDFATYVVEIDKESVVYLEKNFPVLKSRIFSEDFLQMNISASMELRSEEKVAVIGNFPYNISSQIFFSILDNRETVSEVVCMLQKEVAQRIASGPGNRDYGILSVLLQAFYTIRYDFTVLPDAFDPPPKVDSGVIRLERNDTRELPCEERKFRTVVKTGFNQRRKKLSNALKPLGIHFEHPLLDKRAEQLHYTDFITLTQLIFPPKQ